MPFDINNPDDLVFIGMTRLNVEEPLRRALIMAKKQQDLIIDEAKKRESVITDMFFQQQNLLVESAPKKGWMLKDSKGLVSLIEQKEAVKRASEFKLSSGNAKDFNTSYKSLIGQTPTAKFENIDWSKTIDKHPTNSQGEVLLHNRSAKAYLTNQKKILRNATYDVD